MNGYIKDENRLFGITRIFDSDTMLRSISEVNSWNNYIAGSLDDREILWRRPNETIHRNFVFRSKDENRVMIIANNFKGSIYNCMNMSPFFYQSSHFDDCHMVERKILMKDCDCYPIIDDEYFQTNSSDSSSSFKYNLIFDNIHKQTDPLYPSCKSQNDFNYQNVRSSIEWWIMQMSVRNMDPFWFQSSSRQPFKDALNPFLDIQLGYFSGREMFKSNKITIFASEVKLYQGLMKNGRITANITTENISLWYNTLKIVVDIASTIPNGRETNTHFQVETNEKSIVIWGKLKDGKLNGLVRIIGTISNDPQDNCGDNISRRLGFIGHFQNGIPTGYCWKGLLGGSFIYGKVDEKGEFSGDEISYINQDISTGFKGSFKNGIMINAKAVEIIGENCNEEGIKIMKFSDPESSQGYHFQRPNLNSFGDQPFVLDPLDAKYINLANSTIDTKETSQDDGENGAFAMIDIPSQTIIAHNNGKISNTKETTAENNRHRNILNSMEVDLNAKNKSTEEIGEIIQQTKENLSKYKTNMPCNTMIDIPLEFGQSSSKYKSTRGHKLNHSFSRFNTKLTFYDSARFGITSAMITRNAMIPKGEELFAHYGYSYSKGPRWYKNAFKEFLLQNEKAEKENKEKLVEEVKQFNMSNFTKKIVSYQHKLLNKALSLVDISSIVDASDLVLENLLKTHASYSLKPILEKDFNNHHS